VEAAVESSEEKEIFMPSTVWMSSTILQFLREFMASCERPRKTISRVMSLGFFESWKKREGGREEGREGGR
jgi:hypothetical protein